MSFAGGGSIKSIDKIGQVCYNESMVGDAGFGGFQIGVSVL